MSKTIDCCTDNISQDLYDQLRASKNRVNRQYCLQRCWCCYDRSFVVVDGEVIVGETETELSEKLDMIDLSDGGGSA